jgi:dienelactone hydrolase
MNEFAQGNSDNSGKRVRRTFGAPALLLLSLLWSSMSPAQLTPERLQGAARLAQDLEFPVDATSPGFFSTPKMTLFKPEGPGPFPALVLQHQCGGLGGRVANASMLNWAKEAVARGYVAFLIDSLGPRGVDTVCMGPKGGVNFMRGARDAFQAAAHLRKLDFVDKKRIAFAGYSWGAMVGVLASGNLWATALGSGERFAAVASLYPGCFSIRPPGGTPYEIMNTDIDRPLLVLMGESDTETPPADCLPKLEALRSAGAPVEWHVYPETTHCWDCQQIDGFSKVDVRGNRVTYRFDRSVTQDSQRRVFEFLKKHLDAAP